MPVTANDFLWEATGHATTSTSHTVTHPDAGGTTAGTTVLIFLYANTTGVTPPAGFANVGGTVTFAFAKSNVSAGETSWAFTLNQTSDVAWYMVELDNVSLDAPYDGHATTSGTLSNGGTRSSGTTALNAGSNSVAFGVFCCVKAGGSDTQSWSSYTNSFTERADSAPAGTGRQIAVAYKLLEGQSTYETTATFATSAASATTHAMIVLLRGADAAINAPLDWFTGFEFGTHAGMGNGLTGPLKAQTAPTGTWGTNYLIQSGSAKNGGYGLRIVASASTANVFSPVVTTNNAVIGLYCKAVSATGTPVAAIGAISGGSGTDWQLQYDSSTEKFGVTWVGGSTVWQTGTSPSGTYPWIEVRVRFNSSVWHLDWFIDTGTGDGKQTSPTDLTGQTTSATASIALVLGHTASQTATFDYDDVVISKYAAAYPLGLHTVNLLVPETSGATISGTSSNFQRFTANGTLANVNGTEGALLDEVPPTISASSDGVVQVAVAASDYINLPMTTYTLGAVEILAGVRFLASLWGGTGTGTGTLGWRGYDGTTETTLVAASTSYDADSLTTASSTYPLWDSAMWSGGVNGAWTQSRLNSAAIRMGFSTDATPDMGASATYLEVAVTDARRWVKHRLTDDEDPEVDAAVAFEYVNPYNNGTRAYAIDNQDLVRSVNFTYTVGGTPTTVTVNAGDPEELVTVNEDALGNVTETTFGWA